jgi:hypothetical protein
MTIKPRLHFIFPKWCPKFIRWHSTTLRNPSLAHKHDSAGSLLFKANKLNRVFICERGITQSCTGRLARDFSVLSLYIIHQGGDYIPRREGCKARRL